MDPPEDAFDQQLTEFHENLRAMAQHQMHVLASVSANRLRQDLELVRQESRWVRRLKRFVHQAKWPIPFIAKPAPKQEKPPAEKAVVVIDATYTVVSDALSEGALHSERNPSDEQFDPVWEGHGTTARPRPCPPVGQHGIGNADRPGGTA